MRWDVAEPQLSHTYSDLDLDFLWLDLVRQREHQPSSVSLLSVSMSSAKVVANFAKAIACFLSSWTFRSWRLTARFTALAAKSL